MDMCIILLSFIDILMYHPSHTVFEKWKAYIYFSLFSYFAGDLVQHEPLPPKEILFLYKDIKELEE